MGENSLPRKKIDILYEDILGDINDLVQKIDSQKLDVSAANENLKTTLQEIETVFTTFHEDTLAALNQQMVENLATVQKVIDSTVSLSKEAAKDEIEQAANVYLDNVREKINVIVGKVLNSAMEASHEEIKNDLAGLHKEVGAAQGKLIQALKNAKDMADSIEPNSKWETLMYGLFGGALGGVILTIAISFGGIHVS